MPLNTRRSSTRGLPWLFGTFGRSRAIGSSPSQKDCSPYPLKFGILTHAARTVSSQSMGPDPRALNSRNPKERLGAGVPFPCKRTLVINCDETPPPVSFALLRRACAAPGPTGRGLRQEADNGRETLESLAIQKSNRDYPQPFSSSLTRSSRRIGRAARTRASPNSLTTSEIIGAMLAKAASLA